jgi:hypothetical protein
MGGRFGLDPPADLKRNLQILILQFFRQFKLISYHIRTIDIEELINGDIIWIYINNNSYLQCIYHYNNLIDNLF